MKNFTVEIRRKLAGDHFLRLDELVPDFILEFDVPPGEIRPDRVAVTPRTFTAMLLLIRVTSGLYSPMDHDIALVSWNTAMDLIGRLNGDMNGEIDANT